MTARLLSIQTIAQDSGFVQQWRTVLRACGADESFLRTHGGEVVAQRVAEFLLLDRLFPRSALHALTEAEECLEALAPATERAGMADQARRPVGPGPDAAGVRRHEHAAAGPARPSACAATGLCRSQCRGDRPILRPDHARHLGSRGGVST